MTKQALALAIFSAVCYLFSKQIRDNRGEIFRPSSRAHQYEWVEIIEFDFNQATIVGCYDSEGKLWLATVGDKKGLRRFMKIYAIESAHYMVGDEIVLAIAFQTVEGGHWSVMTRDGEYLVTEADQIKTQPVRVLLESDNSLKVCGEDWSVRIERDLIKN